MSGPELEVATYFPTSMSTARSNIFMTLVTRTSGDLAISLKSVPSGVDSKCCSFASSTTGISVTCSK